MFLSQFSTIYYVFLVITFSLLKSFIESAVPPIRLFLMIIIIPLKKCVAKENYLIALLRNEARIFFHLRALTLYS